jgi:hypothetical protein
VKEDGRVGRYAHQEATMTDNYPEDYPLSADQESEEDPEKLAQEAGIDPTAQEVDEYREKIGDAPTEDA